MNKSPQWQALNRKVRYLEKQQGLDRAAHEALVLGVTGKDSMSECSASDLQAIVDRLEENAPTSKPGKKGGFVKAGKGYVRMIWAIWGSIKRAGKLDAEDTDAALLAFVNARLRTRQFDDVRQLDWLTSDEATPIINALKSWDRRK